MTITIDWKLPDDTAMLHVDCENTVEVWAVLCKLGELFNHTRCGCCESENIGRIVRVMKEGKIRYYEWKCMEEACGAALQLHQNDPEKGKAGLYLKWDDKWEIFKKPDSDGGGQQVPI